MTEVTAHLHSYRQSPRKVRLLADLIRGKSASTALLDLQYAVKRASSPLSKLLRSAIANASHNHKLVQENLYVKSITVDQGPIFKRMMPRARGSGNPIHKHTSHISLILAEREVKEEKGKSKKVKSVREPKE